MLARSVPDQRAGTDLADVSELVLGRRPAFADSGGGNLESSVTTNYS